MTGHVLTIRREREGWCRAVCSCGHEQASPTRDLTASAAAAWHRAHVAIDRRHGR